MSDTENFSLEQSLTDNHATHISSESHDTVIDGDLGESIFDKAFRMDSASFIDDVRRNSLNLVGNVSQNCPAVVMEQSELPADNTNIITQHITKTSLSDNENTTSSTIEITEHNNSELESSNSIKSETIIVNPFEQSYTDNCTSSELGVNDKITLAIDKMNNNSNGDENIGLSENREYKKTLSRQFSDTRAQLIESKVVSSNLFFVNYSTKDARNRQHNQGFELSTTSENEPEKNTVDYLSVLKSTEEDAAIVAVDNGGVHRSEEVVEDMPSEETTINNVSASIDITSSNEHNTDGDGSEGKEINEKVTESSHNQPQTKPESENKLSVTNERAISPSKFGYDKSASYHRSPDLSIDTPKNTRYSKSPSEQRSSTGGSKQSGIPHLPRVGSPLALPASRMSPPSSELRHAMSDLLHSYATSKDTSRTSKSDTKPTHRTTKSAPNSSVKSKDNPRVAAKKNVKSNVSASSLSAVDLRKVLRERRQRDLELAKVRI
jgi:hypothetical protein